MTDKNDVLHAAIASIDEDEKAEKKQKANQKKKPEKLGNVLWENLDYLEQKSKRDDKKAKKFIKPKKKKVVKKVVKKTEEKLSAKFDDDSLAVYGQLLSESLDSSPEGQEVANPAALIEQIISKED